MNVMAEVTSLLVDLQHAGLAILFAVVCVLSLWSVVRELQFRELTRVLGQFGSTMVEVRHTISDLCKSVDNSAELTTEHKNDIKQLLLDVEKRITDQVKSNRDWMSLVNKFGQSAGGVRVSGGHNSFQVGDENQQKGSGS